MNGIIKRGVICIFAALLLVMPFSYSVRADGFDDLMEDTNSRFWGQYNLKHFMPEYSPHSICILSSAPVTYCSAYFDDSNPVTYRNDKILYAYGYNSANNSVENLTVPTFTAFSMNAYLRAVPGNTWVIYLSNKNTTASTLSFFVQNNYSGFSATRVLNDRQTSMDVGNNYLIAIKVTNTTSSYRRVTLNFDGLAGTSDGWVLPIYTGGEELMPDSVKYLVGLPSEFDKEYALITDIDSFLSVISGDLSTISVNLTRIISQNSTQYTSWNPLFHDIRDSLVSSNSSAAGSSIDSASSSLESSSDQLHSIESGYLNDMNTQMNNIDFTGSGAALINNGNFLSSANWVRTQFNRLITGNVFGTMIYFSLVLGLSLLVLGKLRK